MPISPYLGEESFDPEQVRAMGIAFEKACQVLALTDAADQLRKKIAIKIIETARTGERDSVRLFEAVMQWASAA